ncbi:MAG: bifunctional 2-polyprenyl-6-hydroxyphenol methylase/3-demethylubiquinol 3-O-methyltransferase UbiG [Alphaproteobacteria bacterium]
MSSIDKAEIARFSRYARDWWNPTGALQPLHKLNPARLEYIRDAVCAHYKLKTGGREALKGLSVLDIGCGGGLLCEPLARLGAHVTGLDASAEAIEAARIHARQSGLEIDYRYGSAEDFAHGRKKFDVVTALEIVEHVADIDSLLRSVADLVKPGGIVLLSTLNRNVKSYLLGIVAAEYLLRWVPRGTHDWRKFLRPSELAAHLEKAGLEMTDITGIVFDPFNDTFRLKREAVSVNYLMTAVKG